MAEYNVKINVKTDTGYDQLYPKSKSDIIDFDKSNSNLSSNDVEAAIKEVNTKANTNKTNIGTLASLTTNSKTNLVGAINEIDANANTATTTANTNKTNIGTLSSLKTSVKNSIVNAINWLYDNVVHKTSVIDNLDDVVANKADGMVAGAKAVSKLNGNLYEDLTKYFTVNWAWDFDQLEVARTGRLVHISFMCHPKDSWSANQIYTVFTSTLPDEYKPEYITYSSGVKMNGDGTNVNNCAFIVQPTGDINIAVGAKVTSGYFLCNMTYVCVGSS